MNPTIIQHKDNHDWQQAIARFWRVTPHRGRYGLTESEDAVVRCLASGLSQRETARRLERSESAIRAHLRSARRVLRVHPLHEIIRLYFANHPDELAALRGGNERKAA